MYSDKTIFFSKKVDTVVRAYELINNKKLTSNKITPVV